MTIVMPMIIMPIMVRIIMHIIVAIGTPTPIVCVGRFLC